MNPMSPTLRQITVKIPLDRIDRQSLAAQQLAAPVGHLVVGPAAYPPFWACAKCGVRWSNDSHPRGVPDRLVEAESPTPYWDK